MMPGASRARRKRAAVAEVAGRVAARTGVPEGEARVVVRTVLQAILGGLARGDTVQIRGFGTFGTRLARGRRRPFFRPAKRLREAVLAGKASAQR